MTDGLRASSQLIECLTPQLREDFYVVDVGCSGGIDVGWRSFGPRLAGVGFDPNVIECQRLAGIETQRVVYEHGFVAAPKRSAYLSRTPWARLSVVRSQKIRQAKAAELSNEQLTRQNLWNQTQLSERTIVLSDYLSDRDVDFLKIDIDGPDFDVMRSIKYDGVLGVSMEVNFIGGTGEDEHTFHNTDRFMRDQGFELFFLSQRFYSIAALPSRYAGPHPAETVTGRPVQGDALYFRDPLMTGEQLSRDKTLKLAGALSLASQHDTAAEVLSAGGPNLDIDLDEALNIIAWEGAGRSYRDHMDAFERDDPDFYTP